MLERVFHDMEGMLDLGAETRLDLSERLGTSRTPPNFGPPECQAAHGACPGASRRATKFSLSRATRGGAFLDALIARIADRPLLHQRSKKNPATGRETSGSKKVATLCRAASVRRAFQICHSPELNKRGADHSRVDPSAPPAPATGRQAMASGHGRRPEESANM